MPYSPADGIVPSTSDELDQEFTDNYNQVLQTNFTLQEIIASNQFKVFQVTTKPYYMELEAKFQSAQALQFEFMKTANMSINIPAGVLPEGRLKAFDGLCNGISYRENYTDPNTQPYEMTICFDSLDLTQTQAINDAFVKSNPQAVQTKPAYYSEDGTAPEDDWLEFTYSDSTGYTKTVYFKNLGVDDYTEIDIKVTWTLTKNGIAPREQDVEDLLRERFSEHMKIGIDFDPDYYINSQDFEGVADFVLTSKLPTDTDFEAGRRVCDYNQKYTIRQVIF